MLQKRWVIINLSILLYFLKLHISSKCKYKQYLLTKYSKHTWDTSFMLRPMVTNTEKCLLSASQETSCPGQGTILPTYVINSFLLGKSFPIRKVKLFQYLTKMCHILQGNKITTQWTMKLNRLLITLSVHVSTESNAQWHVTDSMFKY